MVNSSNGKVIDVNSGAGVPGAQVMVYDAHGKLHATLTTNSQGEFSSDFPAGQYGLIAHADGYEMAHQPTLLTKSEEPMSVVIELKNSNDSVIPQVSLWQRLRAFILPTPHTKFNQESEDSVVRDSVTKQPLDLAVVRLFDQKTQQLITTSITDSSGRYKIVPSPGSYQLEVTREGYETCRQDYVGGPIDLTPVNVL